MEKSKIEGTEKHRHTLPKAERLHSRKLLTKLFGGGDSRAMTAFPLRMVYLSLEEVEPSQMLISVPKRCLHRANKRNRVKRQVREAYRKHKELIEGTHLMVAFIWLDDKTYPSSLVEERIVSLLTRVSEKVNKVKEQSV